MPRQKPTTPESITSLDDLAVMRERQVLAVFPVSKSSWWEGIADGRYPRPVKLSKRVRGWRVRDIRALLQSLDTNTVVLVFWIVMVATFSV